MPRSAEIVGKYSIGCLLYTSMHAFTPYLYPNRADNEAFISERIELESINRYLEKKNEDISEDPYKLFHVVLAAIVKTITLRPKMNRFIKGYRTYQRNDLTLAFVVKKKFADEGKEALAFIKFDEDTTIETVREKVYAEINECRSDKLDNSTAGMDMLTKFPRFIPVSYTHLDVYKRQGRGFKGGDEEEGRSC